MRQIWRKTIELLRTQPLLWLPVVIAALVNYGLIWLRPVAIHSMILHLVPQEHFYGIDIPVYPPPAWLKALAYAVQYGLGYVRVCCFVFALFVTAKLVGSFATSDKDGFVFSWMYISRRWMGALWLALILSVIELGADYLIFLAIRWCDLHDLFTSYPIEISLDLVSGFLVYFLLFYFGIPPAVRLLSYPREGSISPHKIGLGRACSLLAAVPLVLVGNTEFWLRRFIHPTVWVNLVEEVILALPYVLLFVALSLVAMEGEGSTMALDGEVAGEASPSLRSG
jgi:hypothetical protein